MIRVRVDVAALERNVRGLADDLRQIKRDVAQQLVQELPAMFRSRIEERAYPYPDNTRHTLAKKSGSTPLIDLRDYIDSWTATSEETDTSVTVVLNPGSGIHPRAHIPYGQLMDALEHGTATQPARPHVQPFSLEANEYASRLFFQRVTSRVFRR